LADLGHLEHLQAVNTRLTPVVFLAGLLLTLAMAVNSGGHRRQLEAARARAVHDALHDELTGLPNRRLLTDRLDQALRSSRRTGAGLGVLLVDLDRFKEVNDTPGHHYGDELLIQVGQRMVSTLRHSDTVARLGGDEFAVLLPDLPDPADAGEVAVKLTAQIAETFMVHGVALDVEASIGVVAYTSTAHGPNDPDADVVADAATLLQRADQAMYTAKARNVDFLVYDSGAGTHATAATLTLLGELRRALERRELLLHFQPKIEVRTGDVIGVEALVRWQHPTRGLVYPDTFIPVAEHTGLIGRLTLNVLDLALHAASAWAADGHTLPVAVNLSARNLMEEHLPQQISDLLATHQVPASLLHLEVTESAIMLDPIRSLRILHHLSTLGLRISLDDFGAGYTSLAQLRDLPIHELKIDRSFVMTMLENPANALIVRSVIDLGHNLGLTIVAEGVETAEALTALSAADCDIAQGYHISRPLTGDDFSAWYRARQLRDLAAAPTIND
jgi:diguanylate cyclase (GGDEF)-like protein